MSSPYVDFHLLMISIDSPHTIILPGFPKVHLTPPIRDLDHTAWKYTTSIFTLPQKVGQRLPKKLSGLVNSRQIHCVWALTEILTFFKVPQIKNGYPWPTPARLLTLIKICLFEGVNTNFSGRVSSNTGQIRDQEGRGILDTLNFGANNPLLKEGTYQLFGGGSKGLARWGAWHIH